MKKGPQRAPYLSRNFSTLSRPNPNNLARWRSLLTISCPGLHQPTAFFQHVAPSIGPLRRVPDDMPEGSFCDFPREVRLFGAPISERGPEAVDRNALGSLLPHSCVVETKDSIPTSRERPKDFQGPWRERDSMFAVALGPLGRNGPNLRVEVDF